MTQATPKISVVIPAYKPGAGLDRVIDSLDAQTMPQDQFEIVVVDDGSPDDTFERLTAMRAVRPNMTIEKIPPSGWASRPRNIGTALASGEYVLYMDSDDYLYPNALQRCWDFAVEHGSDIVSPKESKTNAPWWGMDRWEANKPNLIGGDGIAGLLPMMPHKMYRRSFLLEHEITYPETSDGTRVLWEDIWFNIEAYRHATVVSVLSDTPVYRWHQTPGSISKSYGPRSEEFWVQLERLFAYIDTALADDPDARDTMFLHQFRDRCLLRFSRVIGDATPSEIAMALSAARRIQDTYMSPELEARLGKMERARAALLRAERTDLMHRLWQVDRTVVSRTTARSTTWDDGVLRVSATTTWLDRSGAPIRFERRGERVVRTLPADIEQALPPEIVDVTDDLDALALDVWVRSRYEKVTWAVPFESTARFVSAAEGGLRLAVTSTARIDPATAGFGRPLDEAIWDVWAETRWMGTFSRGGVVTENRRAASLANGMATVSYRNQKGDLSIDLQQRLRSVVADSGPAVREATGTIASFVLPLRDVAVAGATSIPLRVRLEPANDALRRGIEEGRVPSVIARRFTASLDGHLIADAAGARLEAGGRADPGSYRVAFEAQPDRPVVTNLVLKVSQHGAIEFGIRSVAKPANLKQHARAQLKAAAAAGRILLRNASYGLRRRVQGA